MLSNFQLGDHALLQSFLVGQPEFRQVMQSGQLQQLRQRVIAAYHLGPMDRDETQAYIEHRLKRVGWKGDPQFRARRLRRRSLHVRAAFPAASTRSATGCLLAGYLGEKHLVTPPTTSRWSRARCDTELDAETRTGSGACLRQAPNRPAASRSRSQLGSAAARPHARSRRGEARGARRRGSSAVGHHSTAAAAADARAPRARRARSRSGAEGTDGREPRHAARCSASSARGPTS